MATRALSTAIYTPTAVYFAYVLVLKLRSSVPRCTYTYLTLVWGLCSCLCMATNNLVVLIDMVTPVLNSLQRAHISTVLEGVGAMLTILCCLNVSIVWIEFCLASSRLESLSSKLMLTRKYIVGFLVSYNTTSITFSVLTVVSSPVFYYCVLGLCFIAGVIIIVSFRYGSRRLAAAYLRAATSLAMFHSSHRLEESAHTSEGPADASERGVLAADGSARAPDGALAPAAPSAATHLAGVNKVAPSARSEGTERSETFNNRHSPAYSEESRIFEERARTIVTTARAITRFVITFLSMIIMYSVLRVIRQRELMWISIVVLHGGISCTLFSVCRYVRETIQISLPASKRVQPSA